MFLFVLKIKSFNKFNTVTLTYNILFIFFLYFGTVRLLVGWVWIYFWYHHNFTYRVVLTKNTLLILWAPQESIPWPLEFSAATLRRFFLYATNSYETIKKYVTLTDIYTPRVCKELHFSVILLELKDPRRCYVVYLPRYVHLLTPPPLLSPKNTHTHNIITNVVWPKVTVIYYDQYINWSFRWRICQHQNKQLRYVFRNCSLL